MPFISAGDGDLKTAFLTNSWLLDQFVGNTLYGWGYNQSGELGDNSTTNRSNPIQTITQNINWSTVSAVDGMVAIKNDGTLWCWGYNFRGQLGDNTTTNRSSPVQTVTFGNNWKQVSCGYDHKAAIKNDGTLWCWGDNFYGQLGNNTTTNRSSPVQTVAFGNNWKQVCCISNSTAAIKTDGTLWIWGNNGGGELADNTTTTRSSPVQTVTYGSNWKQVFGGSTSYNYTAIKTDGTLWCWGNNQYGQLGDNSSVILRSSPVQTVAFGTNWKTAACAGYHMTAIKTDGTLWAWGRNNNGQLGDNTITDRSSPVQTIAFGNNWKQTSCSTGFSAAIKNDGTLWCWGLGTSGQLGDNTATSKSSPVQTSASGKNWKQVACGRNIATAVTNGDL